tara:strand:+ start:678 stop:884 length:207 start_codon:yes stop_codon:yes gene_type:complete
MSKEWTLDEFAIEFWNGLPKNQFEANLEWLSAVFSRLKVGGIWMWPEKMMLLEKVSEDCIRLKAKPEE